jgi:hypothetical protein
MNTIEPDTIRCLAAAHGRDWSFYNGDCVDVLRQFPARCADFMVYSPPFSDVFVYSDSERDMGNARDHAEFDRHYRYLCDELRRLLRPGRLVAVHCKAIPFVLYKAGRRGLYDLPGAIIRAHEAAGFEYHSEVCIWKDPVVEMQRTKAIGLLHKQLIKDSSMSRQGLADKLLIFRRPGDGDADVVPVTHRPEDMPVDLWQRWASPVWMDINQQDTLNRADARESDDEKHICPLQLDLIDRAIRLWSNPGEVVLTPFGGIGSELVGALRAKRRAVGVELKPAYWEVGCCNLSQEEGTEQMSLFGAAP